MLGNVEERSARDQRKNCIWSILLTGELEKLPATEADIRPGALQLVHHQLIAWMRAIGLLGQAAALDIRPARDLP